MADRTIYSNRRDAIFWEDETLFRNVRNLPKAIDEAVEHVMVRYESEVANWMKTNAPWTDRTGNARNGLDARYSKTEEGPGIDVFHQVPYGIYLEVKDSGKYAIIDPAIKQYGPIVMSGIRGILTQLKFA